MDIPISTSERVIVPANPTKTGFYRNLFWDNKDFIWGAIEPEEFEQIIEKTSKEFKLGYSIVRKKNDESISNSLKFMLGISTFLILAALLMLHKGFVKN